MGGAGPTVYYDPSKRFQRLQHTGLTEHYTDLQALYDRAKPLFIERKKDLVEHHGWKEVDTDSETVLFCIQGVMTVYHPREVKLELPKDVLSLTEPLPAGEDTCLMLDAQTANHRTVTVIREDDIDDAGELQTTRILPPKTWVDANIPVVEHILNRGAASTDFLRAASGKGAYQSEWLSTYEPYSYDSYGSEVPDFTACDKECAYCGRCDY